MATTCIHESDEIKDLIEKNLQDENKLALHHRITIDVLEFVDIEQLRNQAIILKDYEKAKIDYIDKHRIINSDFLLNKLKPIFSENNTFVFENECKTGNFDLTLHKVNYLISELEEELEKTINEEIKEKSKNGN